MRRKERKRLERALVSAEVQLGKLRVLRKDINSFVRRLTERKPDPTEGLFLSEKMADYFAAWADKIFSRLKEIERIEKIDSDRLAELVAMNFIARSNEEGFKKELGIQQDIEKKTLMIETMFRRAVEHLRRTQERKNIYHFFGIASKIVNEEIRMSEEEVSYLSEKARAA